MVFKAAALLFLAAWVPASAGDALLSHPFWGLPRHAGTVTSTLPGLVKGETLEYDIYWGAIHVGKSFISVPEAVLISSRPAWHIVSEAKSGPFINNFYRVDDRNEAWMDAEDLHSYGYYKRVSEGKFFANEWAVFDGPARRYYGQKMNRRREISGFEGPLEKPVNDIFSAVYRLRAMAVAPGTTVEMDVNTRQNWRLAIKAGKREKIKTDYGKKQCILLEPMAGEEGLFVSKKGRRMLVWITDDELKVPMMLKAEIFIGSVTAKLSRRIINP